MNNGSKKEWQTTLLKIVFLLIVGMLIRDAVVMMFSSLYKLVTNDWQAAAALSTLFAFIAVIVNYLSTKKVETKNFFNKKKHDNNQNFQHKNN